MGQAWVGVKLMFTPATGYLELKNARPFHAGLVKGSSDYIGWHEKVITPEMVGRKVALIVALEVKREGGGRVSTDQERFIKAVQNAGGIAGAVTSVAEASALIDTLSNGVAI